MSDSLCRARLTEDEVREVVQGKRPAHEIGFWLAEDLCAAMESARAAKGLIVLWRTRAERAERELAEYRKPMPCGHPIGALSEMRPDFEGDTPATQRIGTVHCRWCEDLANVRAAREEK